MVPAIALLDSTGNSSLSHGSSRDLDYGGGAVLVLDEEEEEQEEEEVKENELEEEAQLFCEQHQGQSM